MFRLLILLMGLILATPTALADGASMRALAPEDAPITAAIPPVPDDWTLVPSPFADVHSTHGDQPTALRLSRHIAARLPEIARELDLHQRTVKEARGDIYQLIKKAHQNNWRCVLISHGKGLRSATPARLKSYVAHWLIQHPLVLAYCSAQRNRGGVGSVYALIKKSAASREENRERFGQKSDLLGDRD